MKLKGGVIIIGSLIWEDHLKNVDKDNIRKHWRERYLIDQRMYTKVPIRYGRESMSRNGTYTMIFSKFCEDNNKLGQGLILPFNQEINSYEGLKGQAIALAKAEGIYNDGNLRLTSDWGSIGLLINPKIYETDFVSKIRRKWSTNYHSCNDNFVSDNYKSKDENSSSITQDGFLDIAWQAEMDAFDLLIATPVVPEPNCIPNAKQIAQKMIDKEYLEYFQNNKKNNIYTADDDDIQEYLNHVYLNREE